LYKGLSFGQFHFPSAVVCADSLCIRSSGPEASDTKVV